MKIFLAGDGKTELGGWANDPRLRGDSPEPGILETLIRRVKADGWSVEDAVLWKDLCKRRDIPRGYRAHDRGPAEYRNVLHLVIAARDKGCAAVVFSRDRDGDDDREKDVLAGIEKARTLGEGLTAIAGGVAIEAIESRIASLKGDLGAEQSKRPKDLIPESTLAEKRAIAEQADLRRIPKDARSLRDWLGSVADVFGIPRDAVLGP